ncbi:MAG: membrane protein [Gammaproteobacteria bacterium]|jgi:membrane protein
MSLRNVSISYISSNAKSSAIWLFCFIRYVFQQFFARRTMQSASSLAYTTLLSLVPLIAVMFSFFSNLQVFKELSEVIQDFVFSNFVPSFGQTIQDYLISFSIKASHLTTTGIIFLAIIALMLMSTIDSALDNIWHVKKRRGLIARFLVYWAILTLGPVLIGVSFYSTSYLLALPLIETVDSAVMIKARLLAFMPFFTSSAAFTILYVLVPNTHVNRRHAIAGGVTAAVLFELAKYAFGIYVKAVPTYQLIYGAVAAIPMFLIWIYVSWLIVLLGAQISYSLSVFRMADVGKHHSESRWGFLDAYQIIGELWLAQKQGMGRSVMQLKKAGVRISHISMNEIFDLLVKAKWVKCSMTGQWSLIRDLGELTLLDLYKILPSKLPNNIANNINRPTNKWQKSLQGVLADSDASLAVALAIPMNKALKYAD